MKYKKIIIISLLLALILGVIISYNMGMSPKSILYVRDLGKGNYYIKISRLTYTYDDNSIKNIELLPGYCVETGSTVDIKTSDIIEAKKSTLLFRYILNASFYEIQDRDVLTLVNFMEETSMSSLDNPNLSSIATCFPAQYNYKNMKYLSNGEETIEWPKGEFNVYTYEDFGNIKTDENFYRVRFYYNSENRLFGFRIISPDVDSTSIFLVYEWKSELPEDIIKIFNKIQ